MNKFSLLILCAGFGRRMLELTRNIPKPLLKINGKASNKDFIPDLNKVILGFFNEYLKNDLKDWIEDFEKKYDSSIKFK